MAFFVHTDACSGFQIQQKMIPTTLPAEQGQFPLRQSEVSWVWCPFRGQTVRKQLRRLDSAHLGHYPALSCPRSWRPLCSNGAASA